MRSSTRQSGTGASEFAIPMICGIPMPPCSSWTITARPMCSGSWAMPPSASRWTPMVIGCRERGNGAWGKPCGKPPASSWFRKPACRAAGRSWAGDWRSWAAAPPGQELPGAPGAANASQHRSTEKYWARNWARMAVQAHKKGVTLRITPS
jgi:hypothetical protein